MRARRRLPLGFGFHLPNLGHIELSRYPHVLTTVAEAKLEEPLQPLAGQGSEVGEVVQPAEFIVLVAREPVGLAGLILRCPFALPDASHTGPIGRQSRLLYGMREWDTWAAGLVGWLRRVIL